MSPMTQLDALAHELGAFIDLLEQESGALAANQADNLAPLIQQRESANLRLSRLWQALALDMGQAAGTSMEALRERCQALAPEHWQRVEEKLRHADWLNRLNSRLIDEQLRRTQLAIQVLRHAAGGRTLYGADGRVSEFLNHNRSIDSA